MIPLIVIDPRQLAHDICVRDQNMVALIDFLNATAEKLDWVTHHVDVAIEMDLVKFHLERASAYLNRVNEDNQQRFNARK